MGEVGFCSILWPKPHDPGLFLNTHLSALFSLSTGTDKGKTEYTGASWHKKALYLFLSSSLQRPWESLPQVPTSLSKEKACCLSDSSCVGPMRVKPEGFPPVAVD